MNTTEAVPPSAILVDVSEWARLWATSEMSIQRLRKDPDFPADATVQLGPRSVKFRLDRVIAFAQILAARRQRQPEPERLRRSRKNRPEPAPDRAASWVPPQPQAAE